MAAVNTNLTQEDKLAFVEQVLEAVVEKGRSEGFLLIESHFDTGDIEDQWVPFGSEPKVGPPRMSLNVVFGVRDGETPIGKETTKTTQT